MNHRKTIIVLWLTAALMLSLSSAWAAPKKAVKKGTSDNITQKKITQCAATLMFTSYVLYDGETARNDKLRGVYDFILLESNVLEMPCNGKLEFEAQANDPFPSDVSEGMGFALYRKSLKGRLSPDRSKVEEMTYTESRTLYRAKKAPQAPDNQQTASWRLTMRDIPMASRNLAGDRTTTIYRISRADQLRNDYVDLEPHIQNASFEIVYPDGKTMFVKRFYPNKTTWNPVSGPISPQEAFHNMQRQKIPEIFLRMEIGADVLREDLTPR
ncbi:MAG: hypothetical protein CSYNP_04341 [Syntrophus sp. SKADARSKE-3]|nr:hypothetical protein [Syntrophus sp. SKADARSKE-3]